MMFCGFLFFQLLISCYELVSSEQKHMHIAQGTTGLHLSERKQLNQQELLTLLTYYLSSLIVPLGIFDYTQKK